MNRKMSSRERLFTAIKGEEPDIVPVNPSCFHWILDYYGCGCWMHYLKAAEEFDFDPIYQLFFFEQTNKMHNYIYSYTGTYEDLPNVNVNIDITDKGDYLLVKRKFETPGGPLSNLDRVGKPSKKYGNWPNPHHMEHLIKEPEDLERIQYIMPEIKPENLLDLILADRLMGEKGIISLRMAYGADQMFADAFGNSNAMILYHDNPSLIKKALRIFNDYQKKIFKLGLEAGIKLVTDSFYNFSISAGWSPMHWRELVKPLIKENINLVHSYGAYYRLYDDGKWMPIIKDVVELGADVINTLPPPPLGDVDLKVVKKLYGNRICLEGNINIIDNILYGNPEKVRNAVREAIDAAAQGGGFILGTSDSIREGSPIENVRAYFEAGREFGKYPISKY